MKLKRYIVSFVCIAFLLTSCNFSISKPDIFKSESEKEIEQKLKTLTTALEANLKYRELNASCSLLNGLNSKFLIIPLKKDVIDAAIDYKSVRDGLDESQKQKLLQKSYQELLNSNKATFILIIINNEKFETGRDFLYFDGFAQNVFLSNQYGKQYKLTSFSRNFEINLNPGWNEGYLQFENFRQNSSGFVNTYSVNFKNFLMSCDGKTTNKNAHWALLFDDSEIKWAQVFAQGLSVSEVREKYISDPYSSIGLDQNDILNLVKIVLKLL